MTRVFAHRGDARAATENSIAAFLAAIEAGAHGVELDVRRSADGALVVHHDAVVDGLGPLRSLAVRDLPSHVALLDEAMEALQPLEVNVELKNDPNEPDYDPTGSLAYDTVALLEERGDLSRVLISSFDLATLDAVRQADQAVRTGWLLGYTASLDDHVDTALAHGFNALHPFVLAVTDDGVACAHDAGLEVNTWTVNAIHDLERMARLGVDVVITDDVPLALAAVEGVSHASNGGSGAASA